MQYLEFALVPLASGRVAYSIAKEEIFRPVREFVYTRSSPFEAVDNDGYPWRMKNRYRATPRERELGEGKWVVDYDQFAHRKPGFFGQLIECPYCLAFWATLFTFFVYSVIPDAILVLALWALASVFVRAMPSG